VSPHPREDDAPRLHAGWTLSVSAARKKNVPAIGVSVSESVAAVMRYTAHVEEIVHKRVLEINLHGTLTRRNYKDLSIDLSRHIHAGGAVTLPIRDHGRSG
jgi:hypothetical protein